MFKISVFGSGSSGNCILVDTGDTKFLLDAGLSFTRTKGYLKEVGVKFSQIDYILVTHSHGDHKYGLKGIVNKYDFIPIVTSGGEAICLDVPSSSIMQIAHGETLSIGDTKVKAFNSHHDTNEPLYFSIENSIGEKLLYLTDCGSDEGIEPSEHDCYIIEANYYLEGILDSLKSDTIKIFQYNRTTSGTGHLEVNQTINILRKSIGKKTKQIILSHLSSSNANGELFIDKVKQELGFENVTIATKGLNITVGEDLNFF